MLTTTLLRLLLTRSLKPFEFKACSPDWLPDVTGLGPIGLYVHIPFCRSLCSFCPYCKELYSPEKATAYLPALLQEIDRTGQAVMQQMAAKSGNLQTSPRATGKFSTTSLYFGGGTPALMLTDLPEIIEHLQRYFDIQDGIGIELHPKDITPDNLSLLKKAGVTMVSLGLQSFDPKTLESIGRTEDRFAERLQWVREAGFATIDVDLIFAIPGQTSESLRQDVRAAFTLGATQVSTYPFIDFSYSANRCKPLDKQIKRMLLAELARFTDSLGVERTSVWTFAKPGTPKYSSVTRDAFLGFGLSATTLLKHTFSLNTFSLDGYLLRLSVGQTPTALALNFSLRQRAAYFLFWSAYGLKIDLHRFESMIGLPIDALYRQEFALARKLGLLQQTDTGDMLTDRAIRLYHDLEQIYTAAYIDKTWSIARQTAFPKRFKLS